MIATRKKLPLWYWYQHWWRLLGCRFCWWLFCNCVEYFGSRFHAVAAISRVGAMSYSDKKKKVDTIPMPSVSSGGGIFSDRRPATNLQLKQQMMMGSFHGR